MPLPVGPDLRWRHQFPEWRPGTLPMPLVLTQCHLAVNDLKLSAAISRRRPGGNVYTTQTTVSAVFT